MASPRHLAEYIGLRALAGVFQLLPLRAALAVAWGLAAFTHFVLRFRVSETRRRLRQVFPDASEKRLKKIAWKAWCNLVFTGVEVLRMPLVRRGQLADIYESLAPFERVRAHLDSGKGALVAVAHAGNWDLCSVASPLLGLPTFALARAQKNALTDRYLNRMRGLSGIPPVMNDSAMLKSVVRRLRGGEGMAILPDVRSRTPALTIRFLGGTANIGAGTAVFARLAKVPVFPTFLRRVGWTRHAIELGEPIWPDASADREADETRMIQELLSWHEMWIRRYPEQYFWYNKRWVLDPL